ncbi:MAG: hypothetical protein R6V53_03835 [Candidatus Woesearchaeota archaeon]
MKITIDTQKDSTEDIKKTITFLQQLVDGTPDNIVLEEDSSKDSSEKKPDESYEAMDIGISWY